MRRCVACKKFSILDAMILVAALAVGLPTAVDFFKTPYESVVIGGIESPQYHTWDFPTLVMTLTPCLASCTLAASAIGLRHSRPSPRQIARLPGRLACYAASFALIAGSVFFLTPDVVWSIRLLGVDGFLTLGDSLQGLVVQLLPQQAGAAVAGCWLTLALCGRRRCKGCWVERLGLSIGISWIVTYVLHNWINYH